MNKNLIAIYNKYAEPAVIIAVALVVFCFCLPLLNNPSAISVDTDWSQMYGILYSARSSIIENFQFALRSPYFGGGFPLVANPHDLSLSPLFIIILFAGEVVGTKIICVLFYLLCALGMYYLTRQEMGFTRLGALLSCLSLSLCSWLPSQLRDGNFTKIYYYLLPLLVLFILKSKTQKQFIVYGAFLMALILIQGGFAFLAISLFLVIFFTFAPLGGAGFLKGGNLKYLFIMIIAALLLAAVKVIPMAELLARLPGGMPQAGDNNLLLDHSLRIKSFLRAIGPEGKPRYATIYMGQITIIIAAAAFIFYFKKLKGVLLCLLIIITILFGPNSAIDISGLLQMVPGFKLMLKLDKYYSFFAAFLLSLAAGAFFGPWQQKIKHKAFFALAFILVVLNTSGIFINNIYLHKNIFVLKLPNLENRAQGFAQAKIINIADSESRDAGSPAGYLLLKKNIGLVNWDGNVILEEPAIPKYFITIKGEKDPFPETISKNPEYRGELFFVSDKNNSAKYVKFTPNVIEIKANVVSPDVLVVNQNFDRAWKTKDIKALFPWNGLLAIKVPHPGEYTYKLIYVPVGFFIGLIVSVVSVILSCLFLRRLSLGNKLIGQNG